MEFSWGREERKGDGKRGKEREREERRGVERRGKKRGREKRIGEERKGGGKRGEGKKHVMED